MVQKCFEKREGCKFMTDQPHNDGDLFFTTACEAARRAGAIIRASFGKKKKVTYKSRIDVVTDVDIASEAAIIALIRDAYPGHDIVTEETDIARTGSPFRWIIDPVDGTVNYAHDYPFVAVSIGLEIEGWMEIGVVYNPVMEEFFTARRGYGATFNDAPIHVSATDAFEQSLLATGFPYDIRENPRNNLAQFCHIIKQAQAVRRDGSAALNLCHTAMGRFEGYWELSIQPWDIAAGMLIVEEAGGRVTGLAGTALTPFSGEILATNGCIHDRLLAEIAAVN